MSIRLLASVMALLTLVHGSNASERGLEQPYSILSFGSWELQIFCRNIGTERESRHGILLKNGEKVLSNQIGETIQTDSSGPMHLLKYFGSSGSVSGWYFADAVLACGDLPTDE